MLKAGSYSIKGTKLGEVSLPSDFNTKVNLRLLTQAIHVYENKTHIGLAKTKTRAEVSKTKKKLYKQKGTGGARHGAKSAPIFVGGGVAHGPRPIKRELKISKKLAKKALFSAISSKVRNKEVLVVDGLSKLTKTKEANELLKKLSKGVAGAKRFTFVLKEENKAVVRVLRNLKNAEVLFFKNLNPYEVFYGGVLIFDKEIFGKNKK